MITVDRTVCVSNRWCLTALPGVFRVDNDGNTEAFDPNGGSTEAIIDAAYNCPVGAISVADQETGLDLLG
jgi:ferredoxin